MRSDRAIVVLGLLGPTLDAGESRKRWDRWRPSIAVCQHADFPVSRFELIHAPAHATLARRVEEDLAEASAGTKVRLWPVATKDPWDFEEVFEKLLDFARAYPFEPEREDYYVHITTGSHVQQISLFLLTETRYFPGKLLQTAPAGVKGKHAEDAPGRLRVIDLDLSKYDRLAKRHADERAEALDVLKAGIATKSRAFNAMIEEIEKVAIASKAPILLMGPTGAGKSELARRIFELKKSRRQVEGAFVDVNCATIRGDGAMSALFGHVRGAFTGAAGDRAGLLKKADGGVLFLDEVGELGADEQAMLLRALEEKKFFPVGADKEAKSDFQLMCGTNRNLAGEVSSGKFRDDLFARIRLWTYRLPALAERPEDIEPNLDFEIERTGRALGMRVTMNKEARDRFMQFARNAPWPGNFRDLNAAVVRMATLANGARITPADVDQEIARLTSSWSGGSLGGIDLVTRTLGREGAALLDRFDRVQLEDVLAVCRASKSLSDAGRSLFAASRAKKSSVNDADRLRKYLARFDLTWETARVSNADAV